MIRTKLNNHMEKNNPLFVQLVYQSYMHSLLSGHWKQLK